MGTIAQSLGQFADGSKVIHDECSNDGTDAWLKNSTRGFENLSVTVKEQW